MSGENKKPRGHEILLYSVFTAYIFIMLFLLFGKNNENSHVNLIPFFTMRLYLFRGAPMAVSNLLGNVLLFIPMGVYLSLFCRKNGVLRVLLWGFLFSAAVEAAQYVFHAGSADVDDVILNVLGVLVGIALYRLLLLTFKDKARRAVEIVSLLAGLLFIALIICLHTGVFGVTIRMF